MGKLKKVAQFIPFLFNFMFWKIKVYDFFSGGREGRKTKLSDTIKEVILAKVNQEASFNDPVFNKKLDAALML